MISHARKSVVQHEVQQPLMASRTAGRCHLSKKANPASQAPKSPPNNVRSIAKSGVPLQSIFELGRTRAEGIDSFNSGQSSTTLIVGDLPKDVSKVEFAGYFISISGAWLNYVSVEEGYTTGTIGCAEKDAAAIIDSIRASKFRGRTLTVSKDGSRADRQQAQTLDACGRPIPPPKYVMRVSGLHAVTDSDDLADIIRGFDYRLHGKQPGCSHGLVWFDTADERDSAITCLNCLLFGTGISCRADYEVRQPFWEDNTELPNDSDSALSRLARPSAGLTSLAGKSSLEDAGPEKLYITRTISEDLSGTAVEIISLRLAALGKRQRG